MTMETFDPREIPILTDAIDEGGRVYGFFDTTAVHAAIVTETLKLADSLLHQAVKDIEATVFERVFDQLRESLPELVDRVLRENTAVQGAAAAGSGTAEESAPSGEADHSE
jgi:Zn-dependent M32 family carboxypeptidase